MAARSGGRTTLVIIRGWPARLWLESTSVGARAGMAEFTSAAGAGAGPSGLERTPESESCDAFPECCFGPVYESTTRSCGSLPGCRLCARSAQPLQTTASLQSWRRGPRPLTTGPSHNSRERRFTGVIGARAVTLPDRDLGPVWVHYRRQAGLSGVIGRRPARCDHLIRDQEGGGLFAISAQTQNLVVSRRSPFAC